MKLLIFTIYDEKIAAYGVPFFTPAIGSAARMFADLANDPNTAVGKHPEDYTLYHIGYYGDDGARVEANPTPVFVGKATDYIEPPAKQRETEFDRVRNANV